jgi:prepilin-type N-terminal cleavage/methylation domain-containing protein
MARKLVGATHALAFTLPEVLVVLLIMAVLLALAMAKIGSAADRAAVNAATADAGALFRAARQAAIYRHAVVAVRIDSTQSLLEARADTTLLMRRELGATYGVRLGATRDSMAFDARGFGIGASNLSLITRRGRAVDTLFVSRMGRVRH